MFVELMPLRAGRTVLITVAKVDDKTLRVNVIPTQAKADENPALTTPLTYGTLTKLTTAAGRVPDAHPWPATVRGTTAGFSICVRSTTATKVGDG